MHADGSSQEDILCALRELSLGNFNDIVDETEYTVSPDLTSDISIHLSKQMSTAIQATPFEVRKHEIALRFLAELDEKVTEGRVAELCRCIGGLALKWNGRMTRRAGQTTVKRFDISMVLIIHYFSSNLCSRTSIVPANSLDLFSSLPFPHSTSTKTQYLRVASIELSPTLITTEQRLYDTLGHEFAHIANMLVSGELRKPHGASFQHWARKVESKFGVSKGLVITNTHSYELQYKYEFKCVLCGHIYGYQRKSPKISRGAVCGRPGCRGALEQVDGAPKKDGRG